MATNNQGSKAARDAAAKARADAKAAQKARDRKVTLIGIGAVVAIVAVLAVVGIISVNKQNTAKNGPLPKGVTSDTFGVKVGTAWKAANADSIPKLQLWEDFQCPACYEMEASSGSTVLKLAQEGKLRLEWRPTIFLDQNLAQLNTKYQHPNSSLTATMALGCAVDAGVEEKFHPAVFARQHNQFNTLEPKEEGYGFGLEELMSAATQAGLSGDALNTFQTCLTAEKYKNWVNASYNQFNSSGVTSTPTGFLNGKELDQKVLFDPKALTEAISAAAK